jgi:hypothetical protein
MRENLAAVREEIKEEDFATVLIGSSPKTYDTYLSAITATMSVLGKKPIRLKYQFTILAPDLVVSQIIWVFSDVLCFFSGVGWFFPELLFLFRSRWFFSKVHWFPRLGVSH